MLKRLPVFGPSRTVAGCVDMARAVDNVGLATAPVFDGFGGWPISVVHIRDGEMIALHEFAGPGGFPVQREIQFGEAVWNSLLSNIAESS
jgi:hypothetical protein